MIYSDKFHAFVANLQHRLERGERDYGDRSFFLEPAALIEEVRQELRDVAVWSFILDTRLEAILEKLKRVGTV